MVVSALVEAVDPNVCTLILFYRYEWPRRGAETQLACLLPSKRSIEMNDDENITSLGLSFGNEWMQIGFLCYS